MAQLTWRNVDAPSMSGVTDALRLAGQSIKSGFDASREALESFQKSSTQEESARALAATMGVSDPAKLKEILGGYNSSYLTPATVEAIAKRPQEAASLAQTQAQTTSTNISNDFNRENNPLRIEGTRLDNAKAGVDLKKSVFDADVAKKQHEAAPAWNQDLARYRALRSNPDPASQAQAATMAASPEFAARASAAGVTGTKFSDVLDKGDASIANAVKLTGEFLKLDEAKRSANLASTSRAMTENLLQAWGGPAGALRAAQEDPNMPVELRNEVVKQITAAAPNYRTPSEAEVLSNNASSAARITAPSQAANPGGFVSYRNEGATRNKPLAPNLVQAMSFLPQLGITMEVTSGGQDGIGEGDRRTGSTRHDHGGAGDVRFMKDGRALSWENPQDIPVLQQIARQARTNGVTGIGAGPGYMNPTTTHIGFGSTAIWGAKGGKPYDALVEAVGGVAPSGDRVQQALARASQPLAAPDLRGPSGPVRQLGPAGGLPQAAPAVTPGVRLETPQDLNSNFNTVNSMLSSVSATSSMDAQLNPAAPIAEAFSKPKEESSTAMAVAAQLHKLGGDKNDGGILSRSRLTVENINDAVQTVVSNYKVSPDIAGALIQSAIQTTGSWVPILGSGGRKVDYDKLKSYIDRFVDKDGKPKTELVRMMGEKKAIEEKATEIKTSLKEEREIWLQARSAAKRGNARIDVKAIDERYANAQRAADAMARSLRSRPAVEGNSRANTGR